MTDQESKTPKERQAPAWVTLTVAAERVGVSTRTVRRALTAGRIKSKKENDRPNARWLVSLEDVWKKWGKPGQSIPGVPSSSPVLAAEHDAAEHRLFRTLEENARLRERLSAAEARLGRRARRRYDEDVERISGRWSEEDTEQEAGE